MMLKPALRPPLRAPMRGATTLREGGGFGYPLVAGLGDSITANNTTATYYAAIGHICQAQALGGWSFDFNHAQNYGVSGNTTQDVIDRLSTAVSSMVSAGVRRCILLIGTNDVAAGTAAATIISNIATIVAALRAAGIVVDLIPILPRSTGMDATKYQIRKDANAGILAMAASGVNIVRGDLAILDTGSADENPLAGTTTDGTHLGNYGAMLVGQAIAAFYQGLGGYFSRPSLSGALLSPTLPMVGTAGSKGTGASGNVATGWTVARNVGSTMLAACSKSADDEGQIITVSTPGAGGTGEYIRLLVTGNFALTSYSTSDWFQMEADIIATGLANVRGIYITAQSTVNGAKNGLQTSGIATDYAVASFRHRIRTPRFQITTPASEQLNAYVLIHGNCGSAALAGAVEIRNVSLRKVA